MSIVFQDKEIDKHINTYEKSSRLCIIENCLTDPESPYRLCKKHLRALINIDIDADCVICNRRQSVISITFHDSDQTMGLKLACGHPKAYFLKECDLSPLYESIIRNEKQYSNYSAVTEKIPVIELLVTLELRIAELEKKLAEAEQSILVLRDQVRWGSTR